MQKFDLVPIGTPLKDIVSITDPLGELPSTINTAKDTANVIAHVYILQIVSAGYCSIDTDDLDM